MTTATSPAARIDPPTGHRRWPMIIDIVGALIPQVMVLAFLVFPY
ncbi:hypothetical protein [Gordonia insulae]|uniref:Uncharacterized protein n=1 Tax=Gordonia insulae TaxID=2420509 RepID=A0A3G8JRG8_9ACTN|nr:hypothetical protein [Gordonia insulae]AZG47721.1 hypothetical protein D7316_04333 [Gordonia insulae]